MLGDFPAERDLGVVPSARMHRRAREAVPRLKGLLHQIASRPFERGTPCSCVLPPAVHVGSGLG
jgi:hypothetical protein